MRIRDLSLTFILTGVLPAIGGCTRPVDSTPVIVNRPILPPDPAGPKVDVGGPRGGVHVDVPRADGPDIRVDVPPLLKTAPTTP